MKSTRKMDNLTAVLHGKQDLRMEDVAVPEPKEGEVLLSIKNCGICRTDIHLWQQGGCADFQPKEPIIIGHECSGAVIGVGPRVKNLNIGDRVALELGLPCLQCEKCRTGHYNLCKPFSLGGLTRYQVWPEIFCHKLPDHVTDEEGALIEPLAVAVRACRRGAVTLGDTVLIGGAGPIGLSCLLAAQAMGASQTCITDISSARLEFAGRMGAAHTVCVEAGQSPTSVSQIIKEAAGKSPDVVLETSGAQHSLQVAMHVIRPGGCVVPVGLDPPDVKLPLVIGAVKEVDIRGSFSYGPTDYEKAIAMVASRRVDPKLMITHNFNLENTIEACQLGKVASDEVIKIMINCEK